MMCLVLLGGVWEPIVKWRTHMFTIFTPFFTLGPGSTTLYTTHSLSHGLISIQQLYSSCIGCIAIQLYSSYTVYILYSIPLKPGEVRHHTAIHLVSRPISHCRISDNLAE